MLSVVSLLLVVCGAADVPWLDTSAEAPERTPPAPEVYARKDAGWRKQHATTAHGRPKSLPPSASPLDRLKLEQFRHPTCHSQAHQLGREIFADERKTRASPDAVASGSRNFDASRGATSLSAAIFINFPVLSTEVRAYA